MLDIAAPLQTSGDDSIAAMNAMVEARLEARQAASLQTSGYGFQAINARRDSCFAEEEVDKHAETNASKPAIDVPEQRMPSPQDQPTTSNPTVDVPMPPVLSQPRDQPTAPIEPQAPTTRSRYVPGTGSLKHKRHVNRILTAAKDFRGVASELQSSGDADGAAKAMESAEFEERYAAKLRIQRANKERLREEKEKERQAEQDRRTTL